MNKVRVFVSFDCDHDENLRTLLVGQAKKRDSPFELTDWSVKEPMTGDWKSQVRARIKATDQMIVICGTHTHTATGVSVELEIAQEETKPYFLLNGRKDKTCTKPTAAENSDKVYVWTWDTLKNLIAGKR